MSPLEVTNLEAGVRITEVVGVIVAAIYGFRAKVHAARSATDAAASRRQVENDHGTNLRDDLDDLREAVRSVGHQLGEIRRDMDADRRSVDGRLSNLEHRL